MSTATKTMAIKARVFNEIRKDIYKAVIEGYVPKDWKLLEERNKIELFDKWFKQAKEAHRELNKYKAKRKAKAKIQKEREVRGVKPKVKTSLAEYQAKINLVDSIKEHIFESQKII